MVVFGNPGAKYVSREAAAREVVAQT